MDSHRVTIGQIAKLHGLSGQLVRRWVTVFCMALFTLTNVGHAVACTKAHVHAAIGDTVASTPDDDAGAAKQTAPNENHCHGCIAVSVPAVSADASPLVVSTQILSAADYRVDADQRPSDPPPPKSLT